MKKTERERFDILCQKEPRLRALYDRAKAIQDDGQGPSFCANNAWINELKPQLMELVGWDARNPDLRVSDAYDLAYEVIYEALPSCRNCMCYGMARA